jgi:enterobacterial common antigen flippase
VRRLLSAVLILGSSSLLTVVVGILGSKVFASLLGATGVGLVSLLSTALLMLSTAFGLGLSSSGVKIISGARENQPEKLSENRQVLIEGSRVLGLIAAIFVLVLHEWLANIMNFRHADRLLVWWLAPAVFASIAGGGEIALLNGFERLSAMARSTALGATVGGLISIAAVYFLKRDGLGIALCISPILTWLFAMLETRQIPFKAQKLDLAEFRLIFSPMLRLGAAIAAAWVLNTVSQFFVRYWLERNLNLEAAGLFQAAWNVSSTYLSVILGALSAEFFPRISGFSHDKNALSHSLNQQIWLVSLLALPVILVMIVLAPYLIALLYTKEFMPSVSVLRWQLVGDVLKIPGWVFGIALMARASRRRYFLAEVSWNLVYVVFMVLLCARLGLAASGIPYLLGYVVYFVATFWALRAEIDFKLETRAALILGLGLGLTTGLTVWLERLLG